MSRFDTIDGKDRAVPSYPDGSPITPRNQGVIVIPKQAHFVWLNRIGDKRARLFVNDGGTLTAIDLHAAALAELVTSAQAVLKDALPGWPSIDARTGAKLEGRQP